MPLPTRITLFGGDVSIQGAANQSKMLRSVIWFYSSVNPWTTILQAALKDSNLPLLNQGNITPEMLAALDMGMDLGQDSNDYAEDLSISRQSPQDELNTSQDISRSLSR